MRQKKRKSSKRILCLRNKTDILKEKERAEPVAVPLFFRSLHTAFKTWENADESRAFLVDQQK